MSILYLFNLLHSSPVHLCCSYILFMSEHFFGICLGFIYSKECINLKEQSLPCHQTNAFGYLSLSKMYRVIASQSQPTLSTYFTVRLMQRDEIISPTLWSSHSLYAGVSFGVTTSDFHFTSLTSSCQWL